ncbi:hypothetical protein [Catelliglobosispora koreensis]|uniref:hypothetical protein n=1 Tax=Catelliglobosispora koreensis TaxID=129052 RepID=UPI0003729F0F|nr:hypothetical protein [Catelliglobosispora koreensis]
MRHTWSLLTGIVVTPLVWLLVAVGQGATEKALPSQSSMPGQLLVGGCVLAGAGLLGGLIATLRTSPTGAMFTGTIYLMASTFMYLKHVQAVDLFTTEWEIQGYPVNLATPLTSGLLAFAGAMLVISIFSASRWRGPEAEAEDRNWHPLVPDEEESWSYR